MMGYQTGLRLRKRKPLNKLKGHKGYKEGKQ